VTRRPVWHVCGTPPAKGSPAGRLGTSKIAADRPGIRRAGDGNRNRMTSLEVRSLVFGLTCGDSSAGQRCRVSVSDRCSPKDAPVYGTCVARAEAGR
jgi:hypothetical protein